ncbi:hypothetical protein JAAARDRAFT_173841 [Jaapia argillacea MUCL 33604]|uniref:Zn(2)-C6 fungal-type domain-containing protein n=1 Tax=Jaapia argillacea MUCL 33604 TaxID=933084 RepID=A0A067QCK8_9AGAM|nr:hypothetical protein JAAARDRAFT_173841 [Jaapia argillacea MUCL 33604]
MPPSPASYSQYYSHPTQQASGFQFSQPASMRQHGGEMPHHSMQPPESPSIPLDPSLALYPPPYYSYQQPQHQQQQQHMPPQHLQLAPAGGLSSPSSQGSETAGTPTDQAFQASAANGKRSSSAANGSSTDSRKKARREEEDDSPSPAAEKEEQKAKPTRGSRACTVCRRLKMKCVGAEQGPPCKRCQTGNHECIFEESNRGKRSAKKHELLTRSLRKMERTLDTVLRSIGNPSLASGMVSRSPSPSIQNETTQALLASPSPPPSSNVEHQHSHHRPPSPKLHSLPDNSLNPLGLLAEASLANRRAQIASKPYVSSLARQADPNEVRKVGVASETYFKPGPMTILPLRRLFIERQVQPEMLSFVTTDQVVAMFKIFFDHMNMHAFLLDSEFHTPSLVCSRSPFLLTTICAIASKFYTEYPDLHVRLTDLARKLAFDVPAQGYKSVEIVQAYLLLSLWGCGPVERFEQDKTWLLLGMGIRMAIDLNLHRKSAVKSQDSPEGRARDREIHNRERTWLLCFCLDRSLSAQMGKPHSIKEDFIIRNSSQWYKEATAIAGDAGLAAYVDLQRILSRSLDILYAGTETLSGLQTNVDYLLVIKTIETQILAWHHEWTQFRRIGNPSEYQEVIGRFYFNYAMLVVNSFGLQNALERSAVDIGHFFARCHTSATTCALIIRDELGPRAYLKYSPDSHFVFCSYAVLSLLKLVRPEFQAFLDHERTTLALVNDVADLLEGIAAGPLHTPALYSGFLRALISQRMDAQAALAQVPKDHTSTQDISAILNRLGDLSSHSSSSIHLNGDHNNHLQHPTSADADPALTDFQFESEMGPVADMSTFPPTMVSHPSEGAGMLSMDSILHGGFWDNVLVPGYSNSFEGLSGGFVYGAGGSGLITPRLGLSPTASGANTPARGRLGSELTQQKINAAFDVAKNDGGVETTV